LGSGYQNTTGFFNSFFGQTSGSDNYTGSLNVFVGAYSGCGNTSGSNNIYIGGYTGGSSTANRKVVIGTGGDLNSLFDVPDTTKCTQLAIGTRFDEYNPSSYWVLGDENFNVAVGTTDMTTAKFSVGGDIRAGFSDAAGVILTSPNGTKYRVLVSDTGVLSTVLVP
jgi:hypothetical protein